MALPPEIAVVFAPSDEKPFMGRAYIITTKS
jgi:hypothetical protein